MIFKGGRYHVTQMHGENVGYYSQFWPDRVDRLEPKYRGHEGIDLIPDGNDLTIYSFRIPGKVVKDIEGARASGSYGNYVTVWYPSIDLAFQYCHMAENYVEANQWVDAMTPVGMMGETGNSRGKHVHLGCIATKHGYRQSAFGNNGYVDPFISLLILAGPPLTIDGNPFEQWLGQNPEYRGFVA